MERMNEGEREEGRKRRRRGPLVERKKGIEAEGE